MTEILIFALLFIVLIAFFSYFYYVQNKEKQRVAFVKEKKRSVSVINITDDLILQSKHIPFSRAFIGILNNKITKEIQSILSIKTDSDFLKRLESHKEQVNTFNNTPFKEGVLKKFENDQEALIALKIIKKADDVLKHEYNKGMVDITTFKKESEYLKILKTTLNIDNAEKRIDKYLNEDNTQNAISMLEKAIVLLKSNPQNDYLKDKFKTFNKHLSESKKRRSQKLAEQVEKENVKRDEKEKNLDVIFGERRKW